jgi:hypothetical protein
MITDIFIGVVTFFAYLFSFAEAIGDAILGILFALFLLWGASWVVQGVLNVITSPKN